MTLFVLTLVPATIWKELKNNFTLPDSKILSGISIFMKTAVITGASSGIGYAIAVKLKNQGYNVVGSYLSNEDSARRIEKEYDVPFIKCDVSDYKDVCALFTLAETKYGKVDFVIANAGIALPQKLLIDVSLEELERVVSVNLKGSLLTNKRAVLSMLNGGGKIVNVSSVFGLDGGSCEVVYSSTKAGIIGLTKSLADELSSSNIEVCCVCPGLIDTPMNAHLSSEDKLEFVRSCGLDKVPTANDVADVICNLLTQNESLSGKIIPIFASKK